jgi:hypothetical protein
MPANDICLLIAEERLSVQLISYGMMTSPETYRYRLRVLAILSLV